MLSRLAFATLSKKECSPENVRDESNCFRNILDWNRLLIIDH